MFDGFIDFIDVIKIIFIFAIGLAHPIYEMTKPKRYPVTGLRELTQEEHATEIAVVPKNSVQKFIALLDSRSPLAGFLRLFLFMAIIMIGATIVGWVNYAYFDDNLFG